MLVVRSADATEMEVAEHFSKLFRLDVEEEEVDSSNWSLIRRWLRDLRCCRAVRKWNRQRAKAAEAKRKQQQEQQERERKEREAEEKAQQEVEADGKELAVAEEGSAPGDASQPLSPCVSRDRKHLLHPLSLNLSPAVSIAGRCPATSLRPRRTRRPRVNSPSWSSPRPPSRRIRQVHAATLQWARRQRTPVRPARGSARAQVRRTFGGLAAPSTPSSGVCLCVCEREIELACECVCVVHMFESEIELCVCVSVCVREPVSVCACAGRQLCLHRGD